MNSLPWDEIGTKIDNDYDLVAAMSEANVMFNVKVLPAKYCVDAISHVAEGHNLIVRDDLPAALGYCKTRFKPLQNAEAFEFFKPLVDDGVCTVDTIGCFGLGEKVWMLAKIDGAKFSVVEGDDIELYILLVNAHDGTQSVMAGIVPIRVWCSNMFSMLNKSEFELIKFKHTGDPAAKLKVATTLIKDQLEAFEEEIIKIRTLTEHWPSADELDNYFRGLFKCPEGCGTRSENKIKKLKELFIHGKGNQGEKVRGTWYAAYNAASEYLNYEAGRNQESRLKSLWFGANNNINREALEMALERVTVEVMKYELYCGKCLFDSTVDEIPDACPGCGTTTFIYKELD